MVTPLQVCCSQNQQVLNFLRHTLWGATTEAKSMVNNPHTVSDKSTVESVQ